MQTSHDIQREPRRRRGGERQESAVREIASVSVTGQLYMYMYDCTAAATTRQAATGSRTSDERQSVSK